MIVGPAPLRPVEFPVSRADRRVAERQPFNGRKVRFQCHRTFKRLQRTGLSWPAAVRIADGLHLGSEIRLLSDREGSTPEGMAWDKTDVRELRRERQVPVQHLPFLKH